MSRRHRFALLGALALVMSVAPACGDDAVPVITKQQFTDQIKDLQPGVDPAVGSCVYDNVKQDRDAMADLSRYGAVSNKISQATDEKLQRLLARCIRGAEAATSTTTTSTTAA